MIEPLNFVSINERRGKEPVDNNIYLVSEDGFYLIAQPGQYLIAEDGKY